MYYVEILPNPQLAQHVKCYWVLRLPFEPNGREPERILPDGCPELVFNLGERFRRHANGTIEKQPRTLVAGQIRSRILVEPSKKVDLFGVRFRPHGVFPILKQPLSEITDRIEGVETVFGNVGRLLEEQILESNSTSDRIKILEAKLSALIESTTSIGLASRAANMIVHSHGMVRVDELTKELNTNSKTLERHFKREIGITPKLFSRIQRLQKVLNKLTISEPDSWADLAYAFGYVDQAHFIKDFKQFVGETPASYVSQNNQLSDSFVG